VSRFEETLLEHNAGPEMDNNEMEEARPPYTDVCGHALRWFGNILIEMYRPYLQVDLVV